MRDDIAVRHHKHCKRRVQRRIVCAALLYPTVIVRNRPLVVVGPRHFDATMHQALTLYKAALGPLPKMPIQGFVDQWGIFMGRKTAMIVARKTKQLNGSRISSFGLQSENLY